MTPGAARPAPFAPGLSQRHTAVDTFVPNGAHLAAMLLAGVLALAGLPASAQSVASYRVSGDGIAEPLDGLAGNVARGRALVTNRQQGLCLLCHGGPFPEERFQGNLAPDLTGAGRRWTAAQLRLRLVDPGRLQADSIMPAYHRTEGLARVAPARRAKPIFSAQQIEDVVAFLTTLD